MVESGSGGGWSGGRRTPQKLQDLATKVRDTMAGIEGIPEVQVNRQPGTPEMLLSMYRQEADEYNIVVRLQEKDRLTVPQVGTVPLVTAGGQTVPAAAVVQLRRQEGPVSIDRKDQQRIVTVSGTLGDRDLGVVMRDLDERIATIAKPADYDIQFGGEYEEQQEAFRELTLAAVLALMLVLTQTTFNMQAFLGVLVGIVVNNAIILIDYMNQLRREHGYDVHDAAVTAGTLPSLIGLDCRRGS